MTTVLNMPVSGAADLKVRLRSTWMSGDYDTFSRFLQPGAEAFYERLRVPKGARMLDVGCGSGQLALIAARSGASATGCDIATNWIERARARAAEENLPVRFEEGDAEALPYDDGEFDVVASLIGAMFAPDPERVAAELTRVCRPGGTIAMANWTPDGFIGKMFRVIARHIAPAGMPSPVLWGDAEVARRRLQPGAGEIRTSVRMYPFIYPFSPRGVVEFFRMTYGPMAKAFASLDEPGQRRLREELVELWSSHNQAGEHATAVDAECLEVVAIRADR